MKKICFISASYFKYLKGGAELQSYFIAKELAKQNEIHYIFVKPDNLGKQTIPKIDEGINLHPMKRYRSKFFGILNCHHLF